MALLIPILIVLWGRTATDQRLAFIALLIFIYGIWLVEFIGMVPPMIKVTAEKVTVRGEFQARQSILRSDLAYIFRGQGLFGRGGFTPAYFLVTLDDTPQIGMQASNFTEEGVTELAKRLEVPIKGDFTAQVR